MLFWPLKDILKTTLNVRLGLALTAILLAVGCSESRSVDYLYKPQGQLVISAPQPARGDKDTVFKWTLTYQENSNITLEDSDLILTGQSLGCVATVHDVGVDWSREVRVTGCQGVAEFSLEVKPGSAVNPFGIQYGRATTSDFAKLDNYLSVSFKEAQKVVSKNTSGVSQRFFEVELGMSLPRDLIVYYSVLAPTNAQNPNDYNLAMGRKVIPKGNSSGQISFNYKDGSVVGSRNIQVSIDGVEVSDVKVKLNQSWSVQTIVDEVSKDVYYSQVSVGASHSCGISQANELICWGSNSHGQLGLDPAVVAFKDEPVRLGTDFRQVSANGNHSCAIKNNDDLFCWGANYAAQLGDSTKIDNFLLQQSLGSYSSVAVGMRSTCALNTNEKLFCWGENGSGQLGTGDTNNYYLIPHPIAASKSFTQVGVGTGHACALESGTQKIFCWGYNGEGAVGDASTADKLLPTSVAGSRSYVQLSVGARHSCALGTDQKMYCWGSNGSADGRVGGSQVYESQPKVIGNDKYREVRAGGTHSCGIHLTTGELWCMGQNSARQLGVGEHLDYSIILKKVEEIKNVIHVGLGADYSCAIENSGLLKCWGSSALGQTANGQKSVRTLSHSTGFSFETYSMGANHACGITAEADLYCWGANNLGQLGIGHSRGPWARPILVGKGYTQVSAGFESTCAIKANKDLYCWGNGAGGALGLGNTTNFFEPQLVGSNVEKVLLGRRHTCALKVGKELFCWGRNTDGEVGVGDTMMKSSPISVLTNVESFSLGARNTCAVDTLSVLRCWGENSRGQVGNGAIGADVLTPALVNGSYSQVSTGNNVVCAIDTHKKLFCWGSNDYEQLGASSPSQTPTPMAVAATLNFTSLDQGQWHNCGVTDAGDLWCWGNNSYGQIGDGTFVNISAPKLIRSNVLDISLKNTQGCLREVGSSDVHCWGQNVDGQLADGSVIGVPMPVKGFR